MSIQTQVQVPSFPLCGNPQEDGSAGESAHLYIKKQHGSQHINKGEEAEFVTAFGCVHLLPEWRRARRPRPGCEGSWAMILLDLLFSTLSAERLSGDPLLLQQGTR